MSYAIIFYHANCADGTAAAWAAFKKFGADAEYVPCNYGNLEYRKHDIVGKDVYFVDFSEPRNEILNVCSLAARVVVLDHHRTAQAALEPSGWAPVNLLVVFDMERSGAQIAWDFFHPDTRRPRIIDYVADRDLWQFKLLDSKPISAFLSANRTTVPYFGELAAMLENDFINCAMKGATLLDYQMGEAEKAAKGLDVRTDKDGNVYGYGNVGFQISETHDTFLNKLQPTAKYCLTYFDIVRENKRVFSLRSRKGFDVSEVAKRFGGGGHAAASGFTVNVVSVSPVERRTRPTSTSALKR